MVSSHPTSTKTKGGAPWWMKKKMAAGGGSAGTKSDAKAYTPVKVPALDEMMKVY